jgi:para-aminobenzoate synthetase/4-amino-4-deoxychorismate lyase
VDYASYFLPLDSVQPGDTVMNATSGDFPPGWIHFTAPIRRLEARSLEEVGPLVQAADELSKELHVVLGLAYESAPAFDAALQAKKPSWPVYGFLRAYAEPKLYRELEPADWHEAVPGESDLEAYAQAFAAIKAALARGDTYQVNLTFQVPFELRQCSAMRFFAERCGVHPPERAMFVDLGEDQIASYSPELFFEKRGADIRTRPMKGTLAVPDDRSRKAVLDEFCNDPKVIAENIMIVDMVRNDLGAVCEPGSIVAEPLLSIERHRNLYQMTSTVRGRTEASLLDIFKHVFPCASVTGAPKVETTRIIREVESSPRGIYCGGLGYVHRDTAVFSVPIRTALLHRTKGSFGVGGGIVWDSELQLEYEEALMKTDVLATEVEAFKLVEAIHASQIENSERIQRHRNRMAAAAKMAGLPFDPEKFLAAVESMRGQSGEKLRITLDHHGEIHATRGPSLLPEKLLTCVVHHHPVDERDPSLRIKSNSRRQLDAAKEAHPEVDEVLLLNRQGEVAEFCYGNAVLELENGSLITPPVECGCLPGIEVGAMIERGEVWYERFHWPTRKHEVSKLFLSNSVVRLREVRLITDR